MAIQLRKFGHLHSVKYIGEVQSARGSNSILPAYIELQMKTVPNPRQIVDVGNKQGYKVVVTGDRIYVHMGNGHEIMHDLENVNKPFFINASGVLTRPERAKFVNFFRAFRPQHLKLMQ